MTPHPPVGDHTTGINQEDIYFYQGYALLKLTFALLVQAASVEAKLVIIYTDILVQAASVEAKLAVVFTDFSLLFGPGSFHGCEAGHCFH